MTANRPMNVSSFIPLAALALASCRPETPHPGPPSPNSPPLAVLTATATTSPQPSYEEISGTVRSKQRATAEAKVFGRILQLHAELGQKVTKDEILAELDAAELQSQLEQAKAVLDQAQRDLARQQQLIANRATSQQELEAATARVKVATASLAEAESRTSHARITAPFDGVISRKLAEVGDLAMPGKPLLEIESPATLRFETDVPESLLNRISPGTPLEVTLPNQTTPIAATVSEISPVADPGSRTFPIKLDLPPTPGARPGQFGRVAIPLGESPTLLIPSSAVRKFGQMETVFTTDLKSAHLRLVKTGRTFGTRTEILSGLSSGETIILNPPAALTDNSPVSPATP